MRVEDLKILDEIFSDFESIDAFTFAEMLEKHGATVVYIRDDSDGWMYDYINDKVVENEDEEQRLFEESDYEIELWNGWVIGIKYDE